MNCVGLQRCGKSCRLRWTNYLRPDIKRGRFSFEEEETIIQLHSILGNKYGYSFSFNRFQVLMKPINYYVLFWSISYCSVMLFLYINDLGPYAFSLFFSISGGRLLPLACQEGPTMKSKITGTLISGKGFLEMELIL